MTALVVAHTPAFSRVLDIPSPLSPSSFWVRVRVSVRRCYRFSGLYAFHSSDSVAVGIRRPRIVVLMSYKATASSTHALLQCAGHWVHHIRSKSTYENDTGGWGQTRSRTPSALLMVRLLTGRCSPPGRLRPFWRLRRSRGGVFMLGPEQKIGRVYVHHVRKPTYTGLWTALVWLIHIQQFSEPHPGRWTKRIGPPAEHLVRADGLLSHVLAQVSWLSACVILFCSLSSWRSPWVLAVRSI